SVCAGALWELYWCLWVWARLVLAEPGSHRDPAQLVDAIDRHGVTTLHFVPSMLQAFVEHLSAGSGAAAASPVLRPTDSAAGRCGTIRRLICSGEALPA